MLENGALFLGATFGILQSESLEPLPTLLRGVIASRRPEIPVERRVMTANVYHADERSWN